MLRSGAALRQSTGVALLKALHTCDGKTPLSWDLRAMQEFKKILVKIFKRCLSAICHEFSGSVTDGSGHPPSEMNLLGVMAFC